MRIYAWAGVSLLFCGMAAAQSTPIVLNASPTTVAWGYYWSKAKPVLTVHSGDTVRIQTLSTCGPTERLEEEGVAAADIPAYNDTIYKEVKDKGPGGHILTGPVEIAEAEPGDVLEVQILKIDIDAPFACNGFGAGRGFLPNDFPYGRRKIIPLDRRKDDRAFRSGDRDSAASVFRQHGRRAAGVGGPVSTARRRGCTRATSTTRRLVAGTTLFIPVHAKGALFEVGDGHAGQGNGEVDITAMETLLTGTFQFVVHKDPASAVAAGRNAHQLHQHGIQPGPENGDGDGGAQHDRFSGDGEAPLAR